MNIKYHALCGIVMDSYFKTNGLCTLFSILPDSPLILNEVKLLRTRSKFNALNIHPKIIQAYFITHSIYVPPLIYYFNPILAIAYLVHIITDWFTHTGLFSAKPLYPLNSYTIKFGREILK